MSKVPQGDTRLVILHLSDMHLRSGRENRILNKASDIVSVLISDEPFKERAVLLIFSGDIAFSGKEEEYAMAQSFFSELQRNLYARGIDDFSSFIIPGNHDCDFGSSSTIRNILIESIRNGTSVDEQVISACLEVQKEFFEFKSSLASELPQDLRTLYWTGNYSRYDISIRLIGYNTAWMSQLHEKYGEIVLPVDIIELEQYKEDLVISTFHHPFNWYPVENKNRFKDLLESTSDFSLTGHEHVPRMRIELEEDHTSQNYIESGALQEDGSKDNSEFGVIEISPQDKLYRYRRFTFRENQFVDKLDQVSWKSLEIESNRNRNRKKLSVEYTKVIEELSYKFSNGRHNFSLSEIYVYPVLHEAIPEEQAKRIDPSLGRPAKDYIESREVVDRVLEEKNVVIYGDSRSGKTSLARKLQMDLVRSGYSPILINCQNMPYKEDRLKAYLEEIFLYQYSSVSTNDLYAGNNESRILIVDDFDSNTFNEQIRNKLIGSLKKLFGRIILISGDDITVDGLSIIRSIPNLLDFTKFSIMPLGNSVRFELIQNWYRSSSKEIDSIDDTNNKIFKVHNLISTMLTGKLMVPTPFNVLLMLQQVEAQAGSDVTSASYASFCENAIRSAILSTTANFRLENGLLGTLLSEFAYGTYSSEKDGTVAPSLEEIVDRYITDHKSATNRNQILEAILNSGLVRKTLGKFDFTYSYQKYYFISKYIHRKVVNDRESAVNLIRSILNDIHLEKNANIIIFLANEENSTLVIQEVLSFARGLASEQTPCDFDSSTQFSSELIRNVPEVTLELVDPKTHRLSLLRYQDSEDDEAIDVEDKEFIEDESENSRVDSQLESIVQINAIFKTIDIMGHILRGSMGNISGEEKTAMVRECYDLTMRGLGSMYSIYEEELKNIINFIMYLISRSERWNRQSDTEAIQLLEEKSKTFVFHLLALMGQTFLIRLTNSVGSQQLKVIYSDVLENSPTSYKMIDLSIDIHTFNAVDIAKVREINRITSNKPLPNYIIRRIFSRFFHLYNIDRLTVQAVCEELDISYKGQMVSYAKGRGKKINSSPRKLFD